MDGYALHHARAVARRVAVHRLAAEQGERDQDVNERQNE